MLMRQGRTIEAAEAKTFTGNRGLEIEEGLIFEIGRPENTGVDLDEPLPFEHRLGRPSGDGTLDPAEVKDRLGPDVAAHKDLLISLLPLAREPDIDPNFHSGAPGAHDPLVA